MKMLAYTVIDIETTGLKPEEGAEITEIAGVNVIDGDIITCYSSLIDVAGEVSEFIENLTGINKNMVSNAPSFELVFENFLNSLGINKNTTIVIHNAEFDFNFIKFWIKAKCSNDLLELWNSLNVVCSLELARKLITGSRKLEVLKAKFGIKTKSHRALNDVFVTKRIYENLLQLEKEKENTTVML